MTVLKCKMCGGQLEVSYADMTITECEYCGSVQTIPNVNDEKRASLYNRANMLRAKCNFDKAYNVYESFVEEFPNEAEGYWGLVLCKFGVEYVDDYDGRKVPTCHRSSFESVMDDEDYKKTLECSSDESREYYIREAKEIERLRKNIIEVSSREKPYEIFICYKETDEDGNRTIDSVIAQDVYDELVKNGYRVFFSRITLEEQLGTEYEPYIFAALNSSKVMLVFGTEPEYFSAVWVRNEWSRYLMLMSKNHEKTLIPCYKGIDPEDMPKEFRKLQAQDLGKIGAVQDLIKVIDNIIRKERNNENDTEYDKVSANRTNNACDKEIAKGNSFLKVGEFDDAIKCFERALDMDYENLYAYIGLLFANNKIKTEKNVCECTSLLENNKYYKMAYKFADDGMREKLEEYSAEALRGMYTSRIMNSECGDDLNKIEREIEQYKDNRYYNEIIGLLKDKRTDLWTDALTKKIRMAENENSVMEIIDYIKTFDTELYDIEGMLVKCDEKKKEITEKECDKLLEDAARLINNETNENVICDIKKKIEKCKNRPNYNEVSRRIDDLLADCKLVGLFSDTVNLFDIFNANRLNSHEKKSDQLYEFMESNRYENYFQKHYAKQKENASKIYSLYKEINDLEQNKTSVSFEPVLSLWVIISMFLFSLSEEAYVVSGVFLLVMGAIVAFRKSRQAFWCSALIVLGPLIIVLSIVIADSSMWDLCIFLLKKYFVAASVISFAAKVFVIVRKIKHITDTKKINNSIYSIYMEMIDVVKMQRKIFETSLSTRALDEQLEATYGRILERLEMYSYKDDTSIMGVIRQIIDQLALA